MTTKKQLLINLKLSNFLKNSEISNFKTGKDATLSLKHLNDIDLDNQFAKRGF